MIPHDPLVEALSRFLPEQRWFGAKDQTVTEVLVEKTEVLFGEFPALVRVEAEVVLQDNSADRYHVLIGLRQPGDPAVFLEGKAEAVLGEFATDLGPAYGYDALRDPELALKLFELIAPDLERPERVRAVAAEQTNSSMIYDDKYILKVFRRLADPNIDIEVTGALWSIGFHHVAQPLASWNSGESDLALLQPFLAGGTEGWALALTSLRDHYDTAGDPAEAGGDFAAEAERLGEVTAEMHLALASALGTTKGDVHSWVRLMHEQLDRMNHPEVDFERARKVFDLAAQAETSGPAVRIHGDYHLGQVMRTDKGWYVLDFEGEPARTIEERRMPSSPLRDVAGMLRSFQYAAMAAMQVREDQPIELAESWESRNRQAFLDGYVAIAHPGQILPADLPSLDLLLKAFELDKAIYELGYEMAHRPAWAAIPLAAIERLLSQA